MVITAEAALVSLQQGQISAVELLQLYLERIKQREPLVGAWETLDLDSALQQAQRCDAAQAAGQPLAPLHGIPIGIKDTFATRDFPTNWGTPIHAGQQLGYDAAVVERLRAAGAIILGKTVTTEYAIARPNKTRNPHNLEHTPGASSSGSAAAVADGMVPVAIGTQMVGSILRPAAYCGILGFKPSFGTISRYGLMPSCRELDHVGIFAHTVADIQRTLKVLAATDPRDPDCYGTLAPSSPNPTPPKLALMLEPHASWLESEAKAALLDTATALTAAGAIITEIGLPPEFTTHFEQINVLAAASMAANHGADYDRCADQMSPKLRQVIEEGRRISATAYAHARQAAVNYTLHLSNLWRDVDAILTPVTTGPAPHGLENTGSPIFCALWTLCGLPAIAIPVRTASNGLPLAIQLVAARLRDFDLLALTDWVMGCLSTHPLSNYANCHLY
ncbi:amidase [Leptolyngbya sp. NK1-12]|uniref:Amidase n=1 Tax=Leptolyngbya sp. NK1-12 TaxID=2547451 RepID=A0AA97AN03_9CYAN|nr:amidase [Leptolyngbya sp. NK1-12]WNZ26267.1 amidase [Leptolyngbya sp. NK1-12]